MHPVLVQLGSLIIPTYGVLAAFGVLLALSLAQITAPRVHIAPRHAWNILVLAVFAALATSRLLLIVMNLSDLRRHPAWLLAVAMVHHPLLSAVGIAGGLVAAVVYIRWARLPWRPVADCLAAPLSLGMAAEQLAALLAGSGFGSETSEAYASWAVTYTSPLAARWSGTPLGIPLHPVQAYAALGFLLVAALTFFPLPQRRSGDIAGIWLLSTGAVFFLTELFRDWEGRGVVFGGLIDTPQLVALGMVIAGGVLLTEWKSPRLTA